MPSPALQLRAPLLWLLLPLMAGFIAGRHWPPPATGLWPMIIGAGCTGVVVIWAASRNRVFLWMAGLCLSVGLSGYALLHLRYPGMHQWTPAPPREITVVLEVWQTFPAASRARSLTGLATIRVTSEHDRALVGRRVESNAQ